MRGTLLVRTREVYRPDLFSEIVIWRLPRVLPGSLHWFKYRLALIEGGVCVLRYDNEAGKGDHRHHGVIEEVYVFSTIEALLGDFDAEVRRYCDEHPYHRQPDP
jgi:hypothetical protein